MLAKYLREFTIECIEFIQGKVFPIRIACSLTAAHFLVNSWLFQLLLRGKQFAQVVESSFNLIYELNVFLPLLSSSKRMNLHWNFRWGYGEYSLSNCCFKKRRFRGWNRHNAKKAWKTVLGEKFCFPPLSTSKMMNLDWSFRWGYGEDFLSNCCFKKRCIDPPPPVLIGLNFI